MIEMQELYDWPVVDLAVFTQLTKGSFLEFIGEEGLFTGMVTNSDGTRETRTFGEISSWIKSMSLSPSVITIQISSVNSKRAITVNISPANKTIFVSLNLQVEEMNEGRRLLEELEQTLSLLPVVATTC